MGWYYNILGLKLNKKTSYWSKTGFFFSVKNQNKFSSQNIVISSQNSVPKYRTKEHEQVFWIHIISTQAFPSEISYGTFHQLLYCVNNFVMFFENETNLKSDPRFICFSWILIKNCLYVFGRNYYEMWNYRTGISLTFLWRLHLTFDDRHFMTKNEQIWQKSFTNSQSVTDIIEVITQKRNQTTPQCGQLQSQLEVAFEFQIILRGIWKLYSPIHSQFKHPLVKSPSDFTWLATVKCLLPTINLFLAS